MADIGEGEDPALEEIEFAVDNGIFLDNGLNLANGMNLGNGIDAANGMNLGNGLSLTNGITGPYYAPPSGSGLEQWIDVDPTGRKKILRYLVECALPSGVEVQLLYRGRLELLGRGIAGLGPSLQRGMMPAAEQEKVSSCLLARVNSRGIAFAVDMFGPMAGMNVATAGELEAYSVSEGVFFGNLFASAPQAYACGLEVDASSEFRACGVAGCGVVTALTTIVTDRLELEHETVERTVLADCFGTRICSKSSLGSGYSYAKSCSAGGRTWSYPVTAHLAEADVGDACFGQYQCMDGLWCSGDECYLP